MKTIYVYASNLTNLLFTNRCSISPTDGFGNRVPGFVRSLLGLLLFLAAGLQTNAQIAAWDFAGKLGNETTVAATTLNANLNSTSIVRGAGLNATSVGDTYASSSFTAGASNLAAAVSNNDYLEFTINPKPLYKTSLSKLDANFRRSGTGPNTFQWQYSLDGFATAGVDIGSPISYTLTTTNGDSQAQIDLSGISALQNVVNGTTVTFRLYGWGATNVAGTFALGKPASPLNDLAITGTVSLLTVHNITQATNYVNIQDAINAANTNDIIVADAATYNEVLTINKTLFFRGAAYGINGTAVRPAEAVLIAPVAGATRLINLVGNITATFDGFLIDGKNVAAVTQPNQSLVLRNNLVELDFSDNDNNIYFSSNQLTLENNFFKAMAGTNTTGASSHIFMSGGAFTCTNNKFTSVDAISSYTVSTTSLPVWLNVTTGTSSAAINNNNFDKVDIGILLADNAGGVVIENNDFNEAKRAAYTGGTSYGTGVAIFNTLNPASPNAIRNNNFTNSETGIRTSSTGPGQSFPAAGLLSASFNSFTGISVAAIRISSDFSASSNALKATCNWYNNITGPAIAANAGATGLVITAPANTITYANWLNYGTDASAAPGFQLPASVSAAPGSNTSVAQNPYRVLSNAIGCLVSNQTLNLSGTFNFGFAPASSEWAKGNNQVAGDGMAVITGSGDDYSITAPAGVTGVTITAASLGAAVIQGPGDLPSVSLENALYFNNNTPASSFQNWTISNIVFRDFDGSLIQDNNGGNTTAFSNFKIINNQFDIPEDLNATFGGESANNFQNIGIHLSFGSNQEVSGNIFNVDGIGISDDGAGKYSSISVIQTNTSGGAVYDGLKIKNNIITVLGDPDPTAPAVIRGIWENGHNTNAAIEISGNTFSNASGGNTANLNRQTAFWVTSRSGSVKKAEYKNNEVSRFKEGVAWLGGLYTGNTAPDYQTGDFPVEVKNNKFDANLNAVTVRKSAGSTNTGSPGYMENNSFTNTVGGGFAIKNEGTGDAQSVCNWYGSVSLPVINSLNNGPVYMASYLNSGADGPGTGFQPTGSCILPPVHNVTQNTYYTTIQAGINTANNGDSITVESGTYNEQVLVNKSVTLNGIGATQPVVDFTGTVTGKPTLFDVSVDGVTINNFNFNVDLSKLRSAIIASGAAIDNIAVTNNLVGAYGTPAGSFGDRNAVSVNYGGPTNYRVATGGVNSITFTGNTVTGTGPSSYFRSGIAADEAGGTFTGNTLQTISHDVLVRFGSNGPVTISNNNFNGGGVEVADQNAAAGTFTISNNTFTPAGNDPTTAVLRIKNNYNSIPHIVSGNTFNYNTWAVSLENMNSITMNGNTFTSSTAGAHAVVVNTKSITGNSSAIVQVPIGAVMTNNNFNGTGTGLTFLNHDSDNDAYGAFVIGTTGNENNFANTLSSFITFDGQTGSSDLAAFPNYAGIIGTGGTRTTTMACWDQDINMQNNKLDVGAGLQLPIAMNFAERTALEAKLTHKPDNSCLGQLIYFLPVHNITQNTYYVTIQSAINAANAADVIECAEWTFNERVVIDKSLTLQGIDSSNTIITGTGLAGTGNGITINNGVTNVTIQKLTVKNFAGASGNANAGIYAIGGNNNLNVDLVGILDNVGGSGFYANGPVNGVAITHVTSRGHTVGARGIVIWNGLKQNINISDNHVYGNNCCGIELQDGSASGVTMNNNNVHDNGDNGMSAVGLEGPGVNVVSGNTLSNNGRFGIEIKNPNGSGAASGAGSIVVSNNTVSRTNPIGAEVRDIAGIAVFRRGLTGSNVDVPYGVQVNNNSVSGYVQPSNSDGFGIVLEGINHTATGNTLNGNDVGIQRQAGHLPYPGDGDQSNLADQYFGRGNSPVSCGINISGSVFGNITANGTNTRDVGNSFGAGIVVNTVTGRSYCSIQAAINDPATLNGHTITASSGTYNEQVLVNKSVTLNGIGATQPVVDFTGTVTGKPTLFDVSVDGVTINNFHFNTDLSKLKSAVIASGASIDNITITNNVVDAYGTPSSGTYGDRNAVSVNYSGPTNYRVATGGVNSIIFTGNTVNGSGPSSYFRSGIAADEAGGTFTGNTLQTINHDVLVRFGSNGAVTISNNNFNGGGVELSDQNAAAGPVTVSNNIFNGTFAISSAPGTALLRIRNNYNSVAHLVSGNTFSAYDWAVSSENMNSITLDNNTFNTAVSNAHAVVVNTKSISTNSNAIVQVPIGAVMTNNNFNGTGTGLTFLNHDSDNDAYGAFVIGTTGNENNFANTLSSFITFDGQTGSSDLAAFPNYAGIIGTGGTRTTTMACWDQDINMQNNKLDVGAGLQLPIAMNFAQRTALEAKLTHKPDNSCLGQLIYFLPVHNITQNTYYVTIQAAINAANPADVIECAEWTFNERVVIDKSLTLQGIDSSSTVITGTGLAGTGNGITINNGVTNVTIQKLTVKNFAGASGNANAGIYAIGGNNNLNVDLVGILDNVGGSGFYANGPVNGVAITHVTSRGHTVGARGIVIWNGLKQNINISDNHVYGNNCCGIELQDGSASGVTMNNNNVHDNGDNGMSAVGLEGPGVNVLSGNTLSNNGRFGIEIKNPNGSGAASGAGSIVVSNNTVSRTNPIGAEVRDIAGIAVFRRGLTGSNVDVPYGVQVNNNSVSGYVQPSNSDGFGIVLEGINHTATGNTLNGNDVGIQRQAGHLPYPGDGDQSNLADQYFGRGNSPVSCGINISGSVFGNITANGTNTRDVGNSFGAGIVVNTVTGRSYCSIQAAINDPATLNGHTITASSGTYNEQVLVNKSVTLNGIGATQPVVDFTGTVTGKPTLFDVSVDGVTINNFNFNVDLSKLRSAIIASGAAIDNIAVTNNLVGAYGTPAGSFGDRNAVSVNYGGPTNYRVATSGVNSITFTGNTVTGTGPSSYFRSGIAADEAGGTFTGNTLQTISHDVLVRFGSNGPVTISNNNFNGGGVELADQNAAAGTFTLSNNIFTPAGNDPSTAVLRIKNNYNSIPHIVSGNTFNYNTWAVSLENMNSITMNGNTFTSSTAGAHAVVVNTKSITSNSSAIVQVPIGAVMTNNNFNGTGTGLTFLNHDSDNDAYGAFVIGTTGNENNFANTLSSFITFDGQTGSSDLAAFPNYAGIIGTGGTRTTTMACWDQDINMQNNKLDVGAGLQLPIAMNFAERTALEAKLTHKPDNSCLGQLIYFLPVHNITQNTYYVTIQAAINAANPADVIECAEWTFNERVVIDKSLTLQGIDSSSTVITGTGLAGTGNGITINNGVTNVTIQKLTVKNFAGASGNANAGIYAIGGNNNLTVDLVGILDNVGGSGFYANGPVNGVAITHVTSRGHTIGARGITIWNGLKQNINISDNHVYGNNCCGIELQDGSASGVTMNNNNVHDNGDNGMSAVGLEGPGVNVLSGNTLSNNGRFGIEIKNPNGSGAASGAGSIVISNNTVSRSVAIADARDIAGIAVFRRGLTGSNVDVPYGVQVNNNSVSGYVQPSNSDGFGIVLEGINHTATGNTLNGNDVGIQRQAGHLPYPGDGDQSNLADQYFGRGNSPVSCGINISGSIFGNITANGINTRDVGSSSGNGFVTNTNTGKTFCTIQSAINDPLTLNGHTLTLTAGTFNENIVLSKALTIRGAGNTTILTPATACSGNGITVSANGATVKSLRVTNYTYGVVVAANTVLLDSIESVSNCTGGIEMSNGISGLTVKNSKINNNTVMGFRAGTAAQMSGITIDSCEVKGNVQGMFIAASSGGSNSFNNIAIRNSDISNNTQKGMYFEKLSNAVIEKNIMNNNGTDAAYNNNAGIDINLKYGNYSNITIQNNDITNSGAMGTATDPQAAAAIAVKARDDSPSYNGNPATLSTVLIKNNLVTGPQNGIRVGEYGKINNTPTALTIEGNDLSFAFANKTIIKRTNNNVNVVCNWHGTTDLATILATFSNNGTGNIVLATTLNTGVDASPAAVGFQPAGSCTCPSGNLVTNTNTSETFCSIQAAIDAPATVAGHTLVVSAGTYIENIIVNKPLTILGPNSAIAPCSGTRVAEAVVVPATAAIASGEIFHVAASNVTISGFTINGDNTALTSGFTSTNGADIDAAEGVTVYETGVNNLTVTNNIFKNLSYFAVTLYDYPAGVPSTGHVIANNKIQDMGTYDPASTIDLWGGGVLLYNNQYAAVTNNCMTNVRMGVQTGNFYGANPGSAASQVISGNSIQARRRGIFHNLAYSSASPLTITGNTITGLANANETASWDGMLVASMGTGIVSTISNNTINGSAVTAIPTTGISVWNDQAAPLISGGSISGTGLGINVNNFEGYPSSGSNAGNTSATIDGVTVTGATIAAIRVNDNPLNTNGATVSAEIRNNNISGSAAGILVAGSDATANVHDNIASITGNVIGVDINGGTVSPLYRNMISGNGTGIRVRNNGVLGLTTENYITGNTTAGISIEATAGAIGNINSNDISGNPAGFAINNYAVPTVNATCNWWGVAGGNALVTAVGGAGTNYAPWLHSGGDAQPGTNGFQPSGTCSYDSNLYVNDNSNTGNFYTSAVGNDNNPGVPAAPFRTISKAITVAQPTGNTVWVDPGNYPENLVVNKELTFKGRKAGQDITPRFAAFTGLKADTDVESVITAPANNPLNNPNDLVKVLSNNVSFDGFTLDGNNPALGVSTVQDNLLLDIHARRVFTNIDASNGFNPVNNLVIKNNIMQNVSQRGVSLANNGPLSSGILIDSNLIRNYGWDVVNGGQAVILFTNAYADVTHNTIDVPDNQIGLHLQNFFSNGTMTWSNNNVTVGQDAIGIHANLFYAPAAVLNIQDNTVNARTGVTGASDYSWGINVISVQVGSTVNVTNNTVGNSGGELGRGINLWNLPTSNPVTVSGGIVGKSIVGINLDNVDPYFGVGSNTMVNIAGNAMVTAVSGQTGIRARSATVNAVAPGGSVTLNLNNATVFTSGSATGVSVDANSANTSNTATVYLAGGTVISGGCNTPVSINGDQAQLYAGASTITAPASGANNAIQFSGITAANSRENLVLAGGTNINMNANTAARAFASAPYSIVEMDAPSGWTVPSKIAGGLQTVLIDGKVKFSNGVLTAAAADTIEFGNNAADILTGANPEKAGSYILGNAKMLSRAVNNGAVDMLGTVLAAEAGGAANMGNLVISRTTSVAGSINPAFPANQSIRTVWNITPSNITASRTNVRFRYLNIAGDINGQNPASIYAYRYSGGLWQKISASLSSAPVGDVLTTTAFNAPSFSPWTLSSQATPTQADLTPLVNIDGASFNLAQVGVNRDFIVSLEEVANVNTSGTITFRIAKPSVFDISFVPGNGISNVFGGTPNTNGDFTFTDMGAFYEVTTNVAIPAGTNKIAGFRIKRKPGFPANTSESISIGIVAGSGGDNTNGNNNTSLQVTAN